MKSSRKTEVEHTARLIRKHERLQVLRALIAEWEECPEKDMDYIRGLYRKAEVLQNQINAMAI